jgi:ribosome recycling factor
MEGVNDILNKTKTNMTAVADKLKKDLGTLRTGRANPQMVEQIRVDYYNTPTPLKQMAVINISDARTLEIQPWDVSVIKDIEKALQLADLGASPVNDGKIIRISFPPITEDRRKTLTKTVSKMSEDYKVTVRNERRDAIEKIKKAQKAGEIADKPCLPVL